MTDVRALNDAEDVAGEAVEPDRVDESAEPAELDEAAEVNGTVEPNGTVESAEAAEPAEAAEVNGTVEPSGTVESAEAAEPNGPAEPASESSDQHLQEVEKRADETIAAAREVVDRAKETLHDQILPRNEHGYGEDEAEDEQDGPDREDTRGAWPNWS